MAFDPTQGYITAVDADGEIFILQNGSYYDEHGNSYAALPKSKSGKAAMRMPGQAPFVFGATTVKSASYVYGVFDCMVRSNAIGGPTLNKLPLASTTYDASLGVGQIFMLKKIDASVNSASLTTTGSDLIDGAASVALSNQMDGIGVQSNGAGYDVIFRT